MSLIRAAQNLEQLSEHLTTLTRMVSKEEDEFDVMHQATSHAINLNMAGLL
jgi:hypothetical protein